ncbi:MAG: hypothetical protein ACLSDJ_07965 [Butyricimonas faecihominis]
MVTAGASPDTSSRCLNPHPVMTSVSACTSSRVHFPVKAIGSEAVAQKFVQNETKGMYNWIVFDLPESTVSFTAMSSSNGVAAGRSTP